MYFRARLCTHVQGMYVSIIALQQGSGFLAQKVCDLSSDPNREAMWNAELTLAARPQVSPR